MKIFCLPFLLLLIGCTSLTPDRINLLASIAGQAAAIGAQAWLAEHPGHKVAFDAVIGMLTQIYQSGNNNQQSMEDATVERLSSLPITSLAGKDGAIYWSGRSVKDTSTNAVAPYGGLLIWDGSKAVAIRGAATEPVLKELVRGLKRGTRTVTKVPPLPDKTTAPAPVRRRARVTPNAPGELRFNFEEKKTGAGALKPKPPGGFVPVPP